MKSDQSNIRRNEDVSAFRLTRSGDIRRSDQIAAAENYAQKCIIAAWQVENRRWDCCSLTIQNVLNCRPARKSTARKRTVAIGSYRRY